MQQLKLLLVSLFAVRILAASAETTYTIVDTGQTGCYDNARQIACPAPGAPFFGQDAQHNGPHPAYRKNGDGTITDLRTRLMWVQARGQKMSWDEARAGASSCPVGGYQDWRMPTIKELYSLINFNGALDRDPSKSTPYIESVFGFAYGNTAAGEREIDCQDWSATQYAAITMRGDATVFGVNFADGRIKGYPKNDPGPQRPPHKLYVRYVRGNRSYGINEFRDNGNATVIDRATGLMWSKSDSGIGMNWQEALAWAQQKNAEKYLGYSDWRVPNAKELQSIVDYTRAPSASDPLRRAPAIDPIFQITRLADGEYPFFWTNTTHLDRHTPFPGQAAVYIAFGRATGWMPTRPGPPGAPPASAAKPEYQLLDVHGAGAQRSDPKTGDPAMFPHGRGPQGDVIRIKNFVRLVRGANPVTATP